MASEGDAGLAAQMIGRVLAGRYRVDRVIAEGGMGVVYAGRQLALDRAVAIKCIHRNLMASEESVERFLAEARLLGSLNHPNIVRIYDVGHVDEALGGQLFLAMELLAGNDLASVLATNPTPPVQWVRRVIAQVAVGLAEAHAAGIVHRDLKPENIVLEPDRRGRERAKLVDFGIAKHNAARGVKLTRAGHLVGTPQYMAPEQITAQPVDGRTDVYALGVLLFELLTGRRPFASDVTVELLRAHLHSPRPDPRQVAPDLAVPADLAIASMRAMAVSPAERFQDAEALARAVMGDERGGLDRNVGGLSVEMSLPGGVVSTAGASSDAGLLHVAQSEVGESSASSAAGVSTGVLSTEPSPGMHKGRGSAETGGAEAYGASLHTVRSLGAPKVPSFSGDVLINHGSAPAGAAEEAPASQRGAGRLDGRVSETAPRRDGGGVPSSGVSGAEHSQPAGTLKSVAVTPVSTRSSRMPLSQSSSALRRSSSPSAGRYRHAAGKGDESVGARVERVSVSRRRRKSPDRKA